MLPILKRCCLLLVIAFCTSISSAQTWREAMPADWLAAVVVRDVAQFDADAAKLLEPFGYDFDGVVSTAIATLGVTKEQLTEAPTVVGFGSDESGQAYPFLLLPVKHVEQVLEQLGAEKTGDVAVAELNSLFGEIVLAARPMTPAGEGMLFAPLSFQKPALRPWQPAVHLPVNLKSAYQLELSPAGLKYLRDQAKKTNPRLAKQARQELRKGLWPPSQKKLDGLLRMNVPLWSHLASRFVSLGAGMSINESGDAVIEIAAGRWKQLLPADHPPTKPQAGSFRLTDLPRPIIGQVSGNAQSPAMQSLISGYLAYSEGRPDEIEADVYSPVLFARYREEVLQAMQLVQQLDFALLTRQAGDPLYANQVAVLQVKDQPAFFEAVKAATASWNATVAASKGRTKLLFDIKELNRNGLTGISLSSDTLKAAGVEESPDIRQLMNRFVGNDGNVVIWVVKLGDDRLMFTDLPWPQVQALAASLAAQEVASDTSSSVTGQFYLDRYLAWKSSIKAVEMKDAIGWKPPKLLEASPAIVFSFAEEGGAMSGRAKVPQETIRAMGKAWQLNQD